MATPARSANAGSAGTGGWRHRLQALIALATLAAAGAVHAASPPPFVEVQAGDTFSAIAAQYTGSASQWRKLYRPKLSNLSDPNRIRVGMRLELATDDKGERYLRVASHAADRDAGDAATTPPQPATTTPSASAQRAPQPPGQTPGQTQTQAPSRSAAAPVPAPAAPGPQAAAEPARTAPAPAAAPPAAARADAPAAADDGTLTIGVLPNIAAATLSGQYERMQRYLERSVGGRVRVVVPPNFKAFFDAMMRGDYDLAVAAPHFARLAQTDRQMIPLVTYQPRINALFVTAAESKVGGPRDVRERVVAFANPQSLVAMYGQQWLRQNGLEPNADYEVRAARTDLGVGRMLLSGDAAAAILSNGEFRALPQDESARLKVVEVFARIPNFIVMAHPRLDRARQERLRTQLKQFVADPQDGAPFSQATGFNAIVDIDDAEMRELEPFSGQTRRAMGLTN